MLAGASGCLERKSKVISLRVHNSLWKVERWPIKMKSRKKSTRVKLWVNQFVCLQDLFFMILLNFPGIFPSFPSRLLKKFRKTIQIIASNLPKRKFILFLARPLPYPRSSPEKLSLRRRWTYKVILMTTIKLRPPE